MEQKLLRRLELIGGTVHSGPIRFLPDQWSHLVTAAGFLLVGLTLLLSSCPAPPDLLLLQPLADLLPCSQGRLRSSEADVVSEQNVSVRQC